MRIRRNVFALFFITLLVLTAGGIARAASGTEDIYKTELPNGLTVLIEEDHSAPVVSVQMWVRVGSADESDTEAGISHVFEHMLFKGTKKRKVGELAQAVESVGGNINAYTSFDNTVYFLTVPSRHFPTGLDVISDAIQNSAFDPDELAKELEVVLEEIRMNEDSPGRSLYKSVLGAAFTTHTYSRPVIGYSEVIKKLTREDILAFFKKWYVPNNMTLVIAGDVETTATLEAVVEAFKGFERGPDPHKDRPVEPEQKELRADIVTQQIVETHFGLAYHIPELKDPDTYAIDVIANILGGGASSRLYRKLKIEDSLVHGISAYAMTLKEPGLFFITGVLDSAKAGEALKGSVKILKRLAAEGPTEEELAKAKLNLESDFVYSKETMQGKASKLGYYQTIAGDIGFEKRYTEGVRRVSAEDVRRVLSEYFTLENMTVSFVAPESEKDAVAEELVKAAVRAAYEEAEAVASGAEPESAADITKIKLENGITLLIKEAHSNPTVAFYAAFPGGLRFEDEKNNGIGAFVADMLTRGTINRTREDLAREMEGMAGGVGGYSGWNSTGASGKFLSRYFDEGFEIFADVLKNPAFPEDEIEKLRVDKLAAIKRQEDNMPGYTFKLLYRELYQTHPYAMPTIGTPETVKFFNRDTLVEHYRKYFTPERMVLTVVGDVDTERVTNKVRELFKDFKGSGTELTTPATEKRQTRVRATGDVKDKAQTNIAIGFLGSSINDPDSYALSVLADILSGQGGRLFINLRDKQSLAYSVTAFSKVGVDPGLFAVYIGCAPEKKDEAIKAIIGELAKVRTKKVTSEELQRAKSSLVGGYEIGLQEVTSQAADITFNELYERGYDFYRKYPQLIEAVTAKDVQRVAKKYLTLDAYTISVVGPNGNVDEKE